MRLPVAPRSAAARLLFCLSAVSVNAWSGPADPASAAAPPSVPSPSLSSSLSLQQALALAKAHHPELRAARLELEATEAGRSQSESRPNPTVGVEVEDTRRDTRTHTVMLSQPIELGGKRAARMAVADATRDVAAARLLSQTAQVHAAVTSAYVDVWVAQERVRLAESSLALAEGGATAASKRVLAGRISPIDETRAQVAASGVRLELLQARGALRTALHALHAAVGDGARRVDVVAEAVETLPAPVSDADVAQRLLTAPAIRHARRDADRFGALADVERARRTQDVTVSLGATRDADVGRTRAVIGLSVPIPLFDSHRGAEREAARRQDKAVADADAVAIRTASEAWQAQAHLATARAEVESLQRDVLPAAQSAHDAAAKAFELGKFGLLDVLDARRTLLLAKGQYLRALAEAHRSRAELNRLLGTPDDTTPAAMAATAARIR